MHFDKYLVQHKDKLKLVQNFKNVPSEVLVLIVDFKQVLECYVLSEYVIFLNTIKKKIQVLVEFSYKIKCVKFMNNGTCKEIHGNKIKKGNFVRYAW